MSQAYQRPLPQLDELNTAFWTGGENGKLMIQRCAHCRHWQHPPQTVCVKCYSRDLAAEPVSGKGTIYSYTVNVQKWHPDLAKPYVIAIVELDEQPRLLVSSNLVGVDPAKAQIGQKVEVLFERDEDIWLPLFQPSGG